MPRCRRPRRRLRRRTGRGPPIGGRPSAASRSWLLEHHGTPSKLKVGELKQLIFSRTANVPHAKNNKIEDGEEEGAMLREARAGMTKQLTTLCPTSPTTIPAAAEEMDERGATTARRNGRVVREGERESFLFRDVDRAVQDAPV